MIRTSRPAPSRLLAFALLALLASPGCTMVRNVMGFEKQAEAARAMVRITGTITTEGPSDGTLVVVVATPALDENGQPLRNEDGSPKHRGVDAYSRKNPGNFLFIFGAGSYRVGAYEDRNENGILDTGERVADFRSAELLELDPGDRVELDIRLSNDAVYRGAPVDILDIVERDAQEQGRFALWAFSQKGTKVDLDDARFGPEKGSFGLWKPVDFLNEELAGVYFLEEFDPDRIPVLYVHGIAGYPQELDKLIESLDRSRFQAWFYFYPSGFGLDGISGHLSDLLRELDIRHDFAEMAIVAHSMGGLVCRGAILKHFADTRRDDIRLFVSIDSPFGGAVSAERTEGAPIALPASFRDMDPRSAYMTWVFYEDADRTVFKDLPNGTPHHMITGFKGSGSECNDGTVTCESQLFPDLQAHAASVRAWNFTHKGTLHQQRTIDRVNALLEKSF